MHLACDGTDVCGACLSPPPAPTDPLVRAIVEPAVGNQRAAICDPSPHSCARVLSARRYGVGGDEWIARTQTGRLEDALPHAMESQLDREVFPLV